MINKLLLQLMIKQLLRLLRLQLKKIPRPPLRPPRLSQLRLLLNQKLMLPRQLLLRPPLK